MRVLAIDQHQSKRTRRPFVDFANLVFRNHVSDCPVLGATQFAVNFLVLVFGTMFPVISRRCRVRAVYEPCIWKLFARKLPFARGAVTLRLGGFFDSIGLVGVD